MVRERLTELHVDYVTRQVPAQHEERTALMEATGQDAIPAIVLEDGTVLSGPDEEILAALDERFPEPPGAAAHKQMAAAH